MQLFMTFLYPGSDHENPKPGRAGKAQLLPGPIVRSAADAREEVGVRGWPVVHAALPFF